MKNWRIADFSQHCPRHESWKKPEGSKQLSFESPPLFFPGKGGWARGPHCLWPSAHPPRGKTTTKQTRHNLNRRRNAADGADKCRGLQMQINCPDPRRTEDSLGVGMVFTRCSPPHKQKPCQKGLANKCPSTLGKMWKLKIFDCA